jgi:hypothetical protein
LTNVPLGGIVESSPRRDPDDIGNGLMMKQHDVAECTLSYLEHELTPEDFLHFVELDEFRDDWEQLELDVESDLWALQILIMSDPGAGPVIPGTGGLRKVRFAPKRWKKGKSGAVRVCYVYFPDHWTILLVIAYGRNEKDGLSDEEKRGIKKYIEQVERWLAEHNY